MKNYLLLLGLLLYSTVVMSQIKIEETFDGAGTLDWSEYADKDVSALVTMGALDMEVKKEGLAVLCTSDLPILSEYDFKVTAKVLVPKLDEDLFGILFDVDEDFNRKAFLFKEDMFIACIFNDGNLVPGKRHTRRIKLPKAKNRNMEITIEKKGARLVISYDNIEIEKFPIKNNTIEPKLTFYTTTKLKVEELIIDQPYTGK